MIAKKHGWNRRVMILCMLPPIVIYLVMVLLPSCLTFFYSFTNATRTSSTFEFVGLQNYIDVLWHQNARDTLAAIKRTLIFAIAVTVLQNVISLLMAVLFNSKALKGRDLYRAIVFLPYVLGVTVCCFTWVLMMGMDGPIMTALQSIGIESSLLGSKKHAFAIVIFIQIWMNAGYSMVLNLAGLQSIPLELYEAAEIDGAGKVAQFFRITIPLLWSTLSINILLAIIGSLGTVQTILLTTGGVNNTSTLAMRIYADAFGIGVSQTTTTPQTQGYAAAQAIVLFVIVAFFAIFTFNALRKKEATYE